MKKLIFAIILLTSSFIYTQEKKADLDQLPNYDARPISTPKLKLDDLPIEIKNNVNSFFIQIIAKNFEKGYDDFTKNSFITSKQDQYKQLIEQTKSSFKLYGDMKSYDYVNSEKATPGYYKVRYLGNHIDYPTRWIFTFYNSPKFGWIVLNIKFDDLPDFLFTGD